MPKRVALFITPWHTIVQAKLAERAGAVAVMALERIPADIRTDGGAWSIFISKRAATW